MGYVGDMRGMKTHVDDGGIQSPDYSLAPPNQSR